MIETGAQKQIYREDYERYRTLAEKHRERDQPEAAAKYYRKGAEVLDQLAELERNSRLEEERLNLAANLRDAAATLERTGSLTRDDTPVDVSDRDRGSDGGTRGEDSSDRADNAAGQRDEEDVDPTEYLEEPPDTDFDDVGGMTELKETLKDTVIDPLERPDLYEHYDLGVVNGVLLYGPPGTGKTYITRALAGNLDYNFIEVQPTDITSSLVGEAADNVSELFDVARNNQPCLIFIDEIDAIAGQRSGGARKTQSERQMVNQLLQELSDIQGADVIVIAATNLLDAVDDAIKRSGRFDERIEVPPPDPTARVAILRVHLRSRPVLPDEIDWDAIKARTTGYSASDMELVATNAARKALKEAWEADELQYITQGHLDRAIAETGSSLEGWDG